MSVAVLNKGIAIATTPSNSNSGYDVPTNPVIVDSSGTHSAAVYNRLFSMVYEDGTISDSIVEQASAANTQYNNLSTTKGYRIKCYDETTEAGYRINGFDLTNYDYFVLVYSDDYLQHHFARITESLTEDISGDAFEFEPRLGNEIPRNTKFMLFKGPAKTSNVVALTAGILTQTTYGNYNRLFCSRPQFYFYNDRLDKNNELNHNTKYEVRLGGQHIDSHASLSTTITMLNRAAAITVPDFGTRIVDYSKYELKIDIEDKLRSLDSDAYSNGNNEAYSSTWSHQGDNYHQSFYNARREIDDRIILDSHAHNSAMTTLSGPTRYLHYDFSPNKCNTLSNVMGTQIYDSIGGKGGLSESKIIDPSKILNKKIVEFEPYKARHRVFKAKLDEWVDTGVTFKEAQAGGGTWDFNTSFDLGKDTTNKLFGAYEEIKVGTKVYLINAVTGTLSSGVQRVAMLQVYKELTDIQYGNTGTDDLPTADDKVYRRAWSQSAQNLLTVFNLIPNRSNLIIKIMRKGFNSIEGTVTEVDANFKLMLVDFATETSHKINKNHGNSMLNYAIDGTYYIEIERFDGEIETVDSYHENGQTIMEISGRDKLNKLLSPIINTNTLYSTDIIYSSKSPYDKVTSLGTCTNVEFEDKTVTASGSVTVVAGDRIYIEADTTSQNLIYLGTVAGDSTNTNFELVDFPNCENKGTSGGSAGNKAMYKATNKNYVFNKALASNHLDTTVSSLIGTSNKGLYFEGGVKLETDGSEGSSLGGTSLSSNAKAVGYYISEPLSIANDNSFQCRLDDDGSTKSYYTDDVINTLLDFTVLKIKETDNQNTIVEIAPYVPLTLGRVDINYANTEDTTFTTSSSFTVGGASYNNDPTITHSSSSLIVTGMTVTGNGIPTGAYVKSITSSSVFELSVSTTGGSLSSHTLTFNYVDLGTCSSATDSRYLTIDISNGSDPAYNALALSTDDNPRKHHKRPVYIDGVFAGTFVSATYHNDYSLGDQEIRIFIDRDVTTSGGKVQLLGYSDSNESTKLTHELNLLNGGHLHTGKMISLISPLITANSEGQVAHYDFPQVYSSDHYADSYSAKMGTSQYRIYNLEKGNYSSTSYPITKKGNIETQAKEYYAEKPSVIPYYASAYKFGSSYRINGGAYLSGKVGAGLTTDLDNNHSLVESRKKSPLGSKFWDYDVSHASTITLMKMFYPSDPSLNDFTLGTATVNGINPYVAKSMLDLVDPKISRMFIFSNSDLLPYSATRKDSLMYSGQTRDLTNYSVLSLQEPIKGNRADTKGDSVGQSTTLSLTDNDYSSAAIISAEKTINSLKRFSMMRLTELVVDWAFNQIDPENIVANDRTIPILDYSTFTMADSGITVQVTNSGAANYLSGSTITNLSASSPWVVGDIVCDLKGRYIGRVQTVDEPSSGSFRVTFRENAFKTDGLNYYTSANLWRIPKTEYIVDGQRIAGHGDGDGFIYIGRPIHMLKSAVMQRTSYYNHAEFTGYGDDDSEFYSRHGSWYLGGDNATTNYSLTAARMPNLWLPIAVSPHRSYASGNPNMSLVHRYESSVSHASHPSNVLYDLSLPKQLKGGSLGTEDFLYTGMIPVFFDRFSIENGGGSLADIGMAGSDIEAISTKLISSIGGGHKGMWGLKTENNFGEKIHINSSTRAYDNTADGVIFGFKPTLTLKHTSLSSSAGVIGYAADITTGNKAVYRYTINAEGEYKWLNHIDLTGCYLVSENSFKTNDSGDTELLRTGSINNSKPSIMCYVISHEVDTGASVNSDGSVDHILTLDTQADNNYPNRIMQPNHTCFHSFGPKTIIPNFMSCEYTKKPKEDAMYKSEINNYQLNNATSQSLTATNNNDAVQSMYVLIDPDNQTTSDYVVLRRDKVHTLLSDIDHTMCISDGDSTFKSSVSYVGDSDSLKQGLKFDKMETTLGITSVSETMNITLNKTISSDAKRLMIGSVTHICDEAEVIINDLLEENDMNFSLTKSDYPLFLAPNFQGIDLYSAINYILSRKNKQLTVEDGVYTIKDEDSSSYYSKIVISEDSDYQIYNYKKLKSTLDFYNEIIVYAGRFRSVRKDIRSINKRGRKTLEVIENELSSQKEADERATELLMLHSKLNTARYKVTIGHKNISQIKVGDIVGFELKRENISLRQYIVLEITHEMIGNMTLTLGRYSKSLGDRFAELLVGNKKLNTSIRRNEFSDSLISYNILDEVKIKPLRLLIRKRSSTGIFKLGFDTTLNTATTKLGFEGGASITITDLIDEELT